MTTKSKALGPIVGLNCCCCGDYFKGRQWWNRDDGYGLCTSCARYLENLGTDPAEMLSLYGERGVHYALTPPRHWS